MPGAREHQETTASSTGPTPPPAVQGLAVQGLAVQGPAVQGPAVQGPAVQGPAVQGPSVPAPEHSTRACRLVVLVSGTGTLLQALIDACADPAFGAVVVGVGADRTGIQGLARAERAGIATFVHPYPRGADREAWDRELTALVAAHEPDLVISAGFMKLVGPHFLARYGGRMINTHPALLPAFPGMHGPRDALAYGVRITGATVFLVDAGVDTGVIVAQEPVRVEADDTVDSLHDRIKVVERRLLLDTTHALATRPWRVAGRKVEWER